MRTPIRSYAIAIAAVLLSACSPAATEADRAALIGLWTPEDGSTRTVEFKSDGEFDYRYFVTLRLKWELSRAGEVRFSTTNDQVSFACAYRIEEGRLLIDNGRGETCVTPNATPPNPMPLSFRKAE